MMQMDCSQMMGGAGVRLMMVTMGFVSVLTTVALLLAIAALLKYLRSGRG